MQKEILVKALYRYPQKKMPAVEEETLHLIEGEGIEGDCHSDGGDRQISLLSMEMREWMKAQEKPGFCFKKYKENLLLDGEAFQNLRPGMQLFIGETILEITEASKSCHPELCRLAETGACHMAGSSLFAKVIKGGLIWKDTVCKIEY